MLLKVPQFSNPSGRSPGFDAEALDHYGALRRLSRCLTRNATEADDLVQDTYVRAFLAADSYRPGTNLRAWLGTILRNIARNVRRDEGRARARRNEWNVLQAAEPHVSLEGSPEQALLSLAMAPQLKAALESMPKALRDAVWLRDVEGLSYQDMAAQLRIPLGTVMSRISRGRRLLHDRLLAARASTDL